MGRMNWLESILYGLFSGFAEFLPISSPGHQILLKKVFGVTQSEPLRDLMIHTALLLAIIVSCGTYIVRIYRSLRNRRKGRGLRSEKRIVYDYRIILAASFAMLPLMLFQGLFQGISNNFAMLALCFGLNGVLIYIPAHLAHGNKESIKMSGLDGILIGAAAAIGVIPGFSRIGGAMTCAISRGADKFKAYNWILLVSIPAVLFWLLLDVFAWMSVGFLAVSFSVFMNYLLCAVCAFIAAIAGIYLMRFLMFRLGFSAFGYYCWGAALLTFILYLIA